MPPPPTITPLTDPIFEYPHGASFGNSITGGHVYRGLDLAPSFQGRYFFAEFIFRRLFSMPLTLDAARARPRPSIPRKSPITRRKWADRRLSAASRRSTSTRAASCISSITPAGGCSSW